MALKPLRKYHEGSDIAYVLNEAAEAGIVVRHVSSASGTGKPGDANNLIEVPTNASGLPLGILATDVVNIDLSRYNHIARFHRDEVPVCSPVTVVTKGYVYTDRVATGVTPTPGAAAYYTASGLLTTATDSARVGTFRGYKDADGYVGVDVTIGV
jgi:hypothetical protein